MDITHSKFTSPFIRRYGALLFIIVAFILAKIGQLTLPHYWDESWSYATAVQKMYEKVPTLLPGMVDVEATRGHPLFFYASASLWMKMFGASLLSKHIFSLFVSVLLLILLYHITNRLYGIRVAITSTILFASQIFFFVQSSMLLPEVLVALLAFVSIYYFVCEKYIALAVSLSLLFLTKESGLVLGSVLGLFFIDFIFNKNYSRQRKLKLFVSLLVPVIVITGFFVFQKHIYGWYFFPGHIGLINKNLNDFSVRFQSTLITLFIEEKRKWLWLLISGLSFFYSANKNKYKWLLFLLPIGAVFLFKYAPYAILKAPFVTFLFIGYVLALCVHSWYTTAQENKPSKMLIVSIAFSLFYLVFCSFNFYTIRYLMPVLLLSLMAYAVWLEAIISAFHTKLYLPFAGIVVLLSIQSFIKNNDIGDTGPGSLNAVRVQQDIINFLLKENAQKSYVGIAPFQQRVNMQDPACGFIKNKEEKFLHANWEIDSLTKYAVFDNIEYDNRFEAIKNDKQYSLVYETNRDNVWGRVFRKNR